MLTTVGFREALTNQRLSLSSLSLSLSLSLTHTLTHSTIPLFLKPSVMLLLMKRRELSFTLESTTNLSFLTDQSLLSEQVNLPKNNNNVERRNVYIVTCMLNYYIKLHTMIAHVFLLGMSG